MNLECPFHASEVLQIGRGCSKCDFKIESFNANGIRFQRFIEKEGIYDSYEFAYEELAKDDLDNSVYSNEYQEDLAIETFSHIGNVDGLDVAELGVGQGFLLKCLLESSPKSLLSLDIAKRYVNNANNIYSNSGNKSTTFNTSVGNVEFMPYRECFDLVIATDILEHVLNLGNAISRIMRSLKSGGKFICRVPNKETLGQYSCYNGQKYEFAHLRFFDSKSLKSQLQEVGFFHPKIFHFGYQPQRFKFISPKGLMAKALAKSIDIFGFYGKEWFYFNRLSRSFFMKPLRILHEPMELLVIIKKP